MWRKHVRRFFLPGVIEQDKRFQQEIQRLSRMGLIAIGWVQVVSMVFVFLARLVVKPEPETLLVRGGATLIVVLLGVSNILLARMPALQPHARTIGLVSGYLLTLVLILTTVLINPVDRESADFIPGLITMATLVGVTALPLLPTHTLVFGLANAVTYFCAVAAVAEWDLSRTPDPRHWLFILVLTALSTGLTGIVYQQRISAFLFYQRALAAAEDFRNAQLRVLLSEQGASMGRLTAAVSHELNSPIGALTSGVDTLLLLTSRQASRPEPDEQQRLVLLQADVRRTIQESAERLRQLVARMQRFANLDKAEVQSADLNEILTDVAALLEPHWKGKADLRLTLTPLPPLTCRPQKLSAAFYSILSNAIDAVDREGRIDVWSRHRNGTVEVHIRDNGRGIPADDMSSIFDPGFRNARGRITSGNWSMFNSRQIIHEHGGDIALDSAEGAGTKVVVTLPVQPHL